MTEERSDQFVEPKRVRLELLDEGMSLDTVVTPLGAGMYRLEETEFLAELNHHDIIEAEDLGLERLRFIRVAERSELLHLDGVFSPGFLDSVEMQSVLDWLGRQGGYWQREMGGCLLLSIPKDAETDFTTRWSEAVDAYLGPDRPDPRGSPQPRRALGSGTYDDASSVTEQRHTIVIHLAPWRRRSRSG